jgi:cysteinyl-tRNA synthetase
MTLKLYNTASRRKENFRPLKEGRVGIYVCGVTVYDLCHIGHARSAIVFDVLVRYLRARGFKVTYVRNFTDVDDKIIERAAELGQQASTLAEEFIAAFQADMQKLKVQSADVEPKATEHIDGMIEMIAVLLESGFAYVADGDVFFAVEKLPSYGRLSGRKLEDMQAGSRVTVDSKKRHPADFALWKAGRPNEPQWPSPWGPGRPGWHIECSAMSRHYLGAPFDIHGGGKDLLFPHHENERAQAVAAYGSGFANYWIHNGFVTLESEKMSKSLGNFLTIRDALQNHHPEVLRLFLLSKHYRSPLDFNRNSILSVQSGLVRIYRTLQRLRDLIGPPAQDPGGNGPGFLKEVDGWPFFEKLVGLMDDDLNTAGAVGLLFEKIKTLNKVLDSRDSPNEADRRRLAEDRRQLLLAGDLLGILGENPADFFSAISVRAGALDEERIEKMIAERSAARARKDWARADEVRDRLKQMGVVLEDGPQGTTWRLDV